MKNHDELAKPTIGRKIQVIDCREVMGLGLGGGLAQRGTIAESTVPNVIVIAMSPGRRHITKPVCEITAGLREAGIDVSVIVLRSGGGAPPDAPTASKAYGQLFSMGPDEAKQVSGHKLVVMHFGNVRTHIIYKARWILRLVNAPSVVVCQCPVDFEDFARVGVKTRVVKPRPDYIQTQGEILEIVTDIIRGQTCPKEKMNEVVEKVKSCLAEFRHGG